MFRHQKRQAPELSAPLDACTCLLSFGVFPMVVVFTLFECAQRGREQFVALAVVFSLLVLL